MPPGGDAGGRAAAQEAAPDPDLPSLTLWHFRDPRLQSQQQVQESRDRNFSFLSIYRVGEDKFIRLADDELRDVTPNPRSRWAIGRDVREDQLNGSLDGRRYEDVYAVNIETGQRRLAASKFRWVYAASPDGSRLLFYDDGHYFVHDMPSAQTTNVTKGAPVEFWNADNDQNIVKPPVPPIGWASDGGSVLLSDGWDIWRMPMAGGARDQPHPQRAQGRYPVPAARRAGSRRARHQARRNLCIWRPTASRRSSRAWPARPRRDCPHRIGLGRCAHVAAAEAQARGRDVLPPVRRTLAVAEDYVGYSVTRARPSAHRQRRAA